MSGEGLSRRALLGGSGFEEPGPHDPEVQQSYYYVDTGHIAGNVYLFAASRGLAAWFHNCDRAAPSAKLELGERRRTRTGELSNRKHR